MGGSDLRHDQVEELAESARNGEDPVTQGLLRGIEDGWFMSEIAEAAFVYQIALEKSEKKVVGVNCHHDSVTSELEILRVSHEVETEQVAALDERKAGRDEAAIAARDRGDAHRRARGPQHDPADARGLPRRGDARRDLQRPARGVGRVPRARPLLSALRRRVRP